MADRISLSKEWYARGVELLDNFEKGEKARSLFESYIYLWISLTIAAKEYCGCAGKVFKNNKGQKTVDKDEIIFWANQRQTQILTMLKENEHLILELCNRKGSDSNSPIMDVGSDEIIKFHKEFIRYWEGDAKYVEPKRTINTYIQILNRVRNNLFHGGKSFKLESDIQLLALTCPLLKETTKICIETL
jgi:hypothetical protein